MSGRYLVEMRSNTWKFIEMRVWLNDESQIWWIFPRKSIHYLAKNKKWKIGHFKMRVSHKSDKVSHRVSHSVTHKNWRFLRVRPRRSCRGFVILENHITYCSYILMFLTESKHHKSSKLADKLHSRPRLQVCHKLFAEYVKNPPTVEVQMGGPQYSWLGLNPLTVMYDEMIISTMRATDLWLSWLHDSFSV